MALSRRSGVRQNHNIEICFKAVRTHFSEFDKGAADEGRNQAGKS